MSLAYCRPSAAPIEPTLPARLFPENIPANSACSPLIQKRCLNRISSPIQIHSPVHCHIRPSSRKQQPSEPPYLNDDLSNQPSFTTTLQQTAAMGNEKSNAPEKADKTKKPSKPKDLPPPYVDPIPIPIRRKPSTQSNEFSEHPGARGKPADDGKCGAGKGDEKEDPP